MSPDAGSPGPQALPVGRRLGGWIAMFFALAVIAALLGGLGVYAASSDEARSCTRTCHTDRAPKARATGHDQVSCRACHQVSASAGLWLWARGAVGIRRSTGPHGKVDPSSCARCHEAKTDWDLVSSTLGHRDHAKGRGQTSCATCHARSEHAGRPAASSCTECHARDALHKGSTEQDTCLDCHNFAVRPDATHPVTAVGCARCHGPGAARTPSGSASPSARILDATVLHGTVDCKLCHTPHPRGDAAAAALEARGAAVAQRANRTCKRCHEITTRAQKAAAPEGHLDCNACHRQHQPLVLADRSCGRCHEQGAQRQSSGKVSDALRHNRCTSCHIPHDWVAERNGCPRCHADKLTSLMTRSPAAHDNCLRCHDVHGPTPTGERCVTCHKDRATHLATAPTKHKNCASCHDPHAASELPRTVCGRCHTSESQELTTRGPLPHAQSGCIGCHTPHGKPEVGTKTCARCHGAEGSRVTTAGPAPHRECTSCHRPHVFTPPAQGGACAKCHEKIASGPEAHLGSCPQCHAPHGSPLVEQKACKKCHTGVELAAINPKHGECSSCHKPHRKAVGAVEQCRGCHGAKAEVAETWPPASPHAQACNGCHTPHDVKKTPPCSSCHAQQADEAKGGPHRCVGCHAPHRADPGGKAWWTVCSSCHAPELAKTAATKGHRACDNCHKPHRFAPAPCVTCHENVSRTAGHAVEQHKKCSACHDGHAASLPARQQCLTCHLDCKDHEPAARLCQACHPFK